ncbi:hypothetical protein N8742_02905 [Emcibacteraceae bacterium]|nr:hypothetical protein [Emcibacteraceae bacterium]
MFEHWNDEAYSFLFRLLSLPRSKASKALFLPSTVFGPVDFPPCILQRPFGLAGALQGLPARVLASHNCFEIVLLFLLRIYL